MKKDNNIWSSNDSVVELYFNSAGDLVFYDDGMHHFLSMKEINNSEKLSFFLKLIMRSVYSKGYDKRQDEVQKLLKNLMGE